MTWNLDATLQAGRGAVLLRSPNTAGPTYAAILTFVSSNGVTLPAGTETIGEMDADELPAWESEGGETEVKRTWFREKAAEVVTSVQVDSMVMKLLQFDNATLSLYAQGGTYANPDEFIFPTTKTPVEKGVTVIYIGGNQVVVEDLGRMTFKGEGAIEHSIDGTYSKIPVRTTLLTPTNATPERRMLGEHLGTPA